MDKIKEDMTSPGAFNNVGSGGIDGIGVGPKGEPGVPNKKKLRAIAPIIAPMLKRKGQ
jgi:hypothetical protein